MAGTKLDRDLQRKILTHLSDLYPQSENNLGSAFPEADERVLAANLQYLAQHGLIEVPWFRTITKGLQANGATFTAKGADFLADDGGLSSILNVVTIRLHEDTLKAILLHHVEESTAEPSLKAQLVGKIKSLSGKGLETVVTEGVKAGLSRLPEMAPWLLKLLQ